MSRSRKLPPARPFEFWRAAYLVEALDYRARSLSELLSGVTLAPARSIFFHLHQRFFREPGLLPNYPNDFAEWADRVLGDAVLAERLANLNLSRTKELERIRREISMILAEHMDRGSDDRRVVLENAFIFCLPRLVLFPSGLRSRDAGEPIRLPAA